VAEPARNQSRPLTDDEPPLDPEAIPRAYRFHRAQRRAKFERRQRSREAALRFLVVFTLLLAGAIAIALVMWHEVQRLFGI
jgi:hypothetical protein